jgi:hypothetical protein
MPKWLVKGAGACVVAACAVACLAATASADSLLQSPHYHFDESAIGNGGLIQSTSTNYQISEILGDPAIGNTASANYQIEAGSKTTDEPALSFSIISPTPSFGSFSPSTAATATATFSVSDYTSYGYVVQVAGNSLANGSHTITAMSTTGSSVTGTEQFGINLVANTSPASVGANPDHGQFGFGNAATNYNTSNQYRYVSGETIAVGPKSSGVTIYTITYIVNVSSLTPGGQYSTNQVLVCTGTY